MRRAICAVYDESWEDRRCYQKHNGIAQFYYYEHVSQSCVEAKSISI